MVRVLVLSVVNCGFKCCYKIGIFYFFARHETLRSKSKDWFVRNQDSVSDRSRPRHYRLSDCLVPVKTDVGQVDLVLRLSDGTSEKNQRFPNAPVRRTNLFPLV
jgi:hypothetical protein